MIRVPTVCRMAVLLVLLPLACPVRCDPEPGMGSELKDDAIWSVQAVWSDVKTIVSAPLHVARLKDVTWRQVLVAAGALAAIGVTIPLDQDIRNSAVGIGSKTARDIQTAATTASWVSLGALYAAGLWAGRDDWRHHALTGGESALVSAQLVSLTKEAFGRQRPNANKGAYRWWDNGDSFVSDAATPPFAIAEAVSDAFEHRWWVTAPAYAAALAVGAGRMGQDDHWASDIVGSAVLGIATQTLFQTLHQDVGQPPAVAPPAASSESTPAAR
jgi:PAP2 superfamily